MIQTESTPNPNSLKFLSDKIISEIGTEEFQKDQSIDGAVRSIHRIIPFIW